ncbi:MAG: anthranilate phosphoribosyltransferase [SAR202 cluster bacterium]|jgi:anthranilate phosphoribosyltransferase|nr:anthranilate phosphoribosyltransferase [SAR202 cluster bacterium]
MIQDAIESIVDGRDLSQHDASLAMDEIMNGDATPAQFGSFVTALRMKGETPEEIAGMALVMREKSLHVDVNGRAVDTCGTGGDGSGTFNISTTAGFVIAGTGIVVAKHGNRAMSGTCGSADVLEALGVKITLGPNNVKRCLEEVGFGFMFAQVFHPSMKYAAGPRREIGIRTAFNMLGPLTNPANVDSQLIGVANPDLAEKIINVLAILGSRHALVVHGAGGIDEISLEGPTKIWELKNGQISLNEIAPVDMGLDPMPTNNLKVTSVAQSVEIVRNVLSGQRGAARDVVLANAAGALLAADRVTTIAEGIEVAAKSIDSGNASEKLTALVKLTSKLE